MRELLQRSRLERAIGVIYRPESERISHYFEARMADQFDAVLHFDGTRAVEPMEREQLWEGGRGAGDLPLHVMTQIGAARTDEHLAPATSLTELSGCASSNLFRGIKQF